LINNLPYNTELYNTELYNAELISVLICQIRAN